MRVLVIVLTILALAGLSVFAFTKIRPALEKRNQESTMSSNSKEVVESEIENKESTQEVSGEIEVDSELQEIDILFKNMNDSDFNDSELSDL